MKKARRLVCAFLSVCILFGLVAVSGSIFNVSADNATVKELLNLNFENGSVAGWTAHTTSKWNVQDYNTFGVVADPVGSNGSKVMKIQHYNPNASYQVKYDLNGAAYNVTLEYKFSTVRWASTASHVTYLPVLLYDCEETAPLGLYTQESGSRVHSKHYSLLLLKGSWLCHQR